MDVSELDCNKFQYSVSPERIIKSNKYFHEKDKKLSIGVELLLNHVLGKLGVYDPIFGKDNYDKPYLKNHSQIYYNLSHSENYVACAVSDSPVGVDIEYIDTFNWDLAKKCFYGSEYEYILNKNNSNNAFFELWVLKESYMKMTGLGFRLGLDEFSVEISDEIRLNHHENTVNFGLWNVGEHMLGVCSQSSINEPDLICLDDLSI
jgi:4'-phosphopantetheinyl transferase